MNYKETDLGADGDNAVSLLLRPWDRRTVSIEARKTEREPPAAPPQTPSTLVLFAVTLAKIPTAWHMLAVVFIGAPPPQGKYHCASDEKWWIWEGGCPTGNASTQCTWVGNTSSDFFSISMQWGLVCERAALVPTSQTGYLIGILLGGALAFKLIPRYGPRRLLLLGLSCQPFLGVALAICPFYAGHFILKFLMACASASVLTCAAAFCEGVGYYVCLIEIGWSLGVLTMAGICVVVSQIEILGQDWRMLYMVLAALSSVPLIICSWVLPEISQRPRDRTAVPESRKQRLSIKGVMYQCVLHSLWGLVTISFFGGLLNARNLSASDAVEDVSTIAAAAAVAEVIGFLIGSRLLKLSKEQRFAWIGAALLAGGTVCTASGIVINTSPTYATHDYGALILPAGALTLRVPVAASLGILPSLTDTQHLYTCLISARSYLQIAPFIAFLGILGSSVAVGGFGLVGLAAGMLAVILATLGSFKATKKTAAEGSNGRTVT